MFWQITSKKLTILWNNKLYITREVLPVIFKIVDSRWSDPMLWVLSSLKLWCQANGLAIKYMECTRVYTVKVPWVQLRVIPLFMLFMLCNQLNASADCLPYPHLVWKVDHYFMSLFYFYYWAQKLRKYTVSIELTETSHCTLFHGVIHYR